MFEIRFNGSETSNHHKCESRRNGDWIIFYCPRCPEFERKLNWRTGELETKGAVKEINHSGSYFPAEYRDAFENVN